MEKKIVKTHISNIRTGNTTIHNGKEMTVCKKDIKQDSFMGVSIFGDCYHSGHKLVEQVLFPQWYKGEFKGWA